VVGSAAILRVSVALGVCAALINLLVWRQPIMEMANGHTSTFKVLYAMWFVLAWGVATGALTGLAISSMRRRSPGRLSAAVAFVVGLFLTSTVCLVLSRGFTDDKIYARRNERTAPCSSRPRRNDLALGRFSSHQLLARAKCDCAQTFGLGGNLRS